MGIRIITERCTGCGVCGNTCAFGAVEVINGAAIFKETCTLCGACQKECPAAAIIIETATVKPAGRDDSEGGWGFAEQRNGVIKAAAFELLSQGRELAKTLGTYLGAVCIGHNISNLADVAACGADRIFVADDLDLATPQDEPYARILTDLVHKHKPAILLAGATAFGRSFIPQVAAALETGLTADCTGLDIDPEKRLLRQTRPTFGGNVMATIVCETHRPQMATVRPHVFKKSPGVARRPGGVTRVDLKKEAVTSRTKILNFIEDVSEKVKLEDSNIIVSGGRGLGKPEKFKVLQELADAMGAALGSSRPPVDEGWIGYSHQVGQTGKTVCPKLYIACGISGAVQHLAGMQTADCIVAINEDPRAPIFEVANYGIVGDLFKIVPLLTERLKKS